MLLCTDQQLDDLRCHAWVLEETTDDFTSALNGNNASSATTINSSSSSTGTNNSFETGDCSPVNSTIVTRTVVLKHQHCHMTLMIDAYRPQKVRNSYYSYLQYFT